MLLDLSDDEDEVSSSEPSSPEAEAVIDIDANSDIILNVPEYAAEIHDYLKKAEVSFKNVSDSSLLGFACCA